jgi:hypothetical protein
MEFRGQVLLNVTTGQYIEDYRLADLKGLLCKKTLQDAKLVGGLGESHWKRTDKIVTIPMKWDDYVRRQYSRIYF